MIHRSGLMTLAMILKVSLYESTDFGKKRTGYEYIISRVYHWLELLKSSLILQFEWSDERKHLIHSTAIWERCACVLLARMNDAIGFLYPWLSIQEGVYPLIWRSGAPSSETTLDRVLFRRQHPVYFIFKQQKNANAPPRPLSARLCIWNNK